MRIALALVLVASPVFAQTAVPAPFADRYWIEWDQPEPDALTQDYILLLDGARQPAQRPTSCASSPAGQTCRIPFPALTPGNHVLVLVASRPYGTQTLESRPSNELQVRVVVAPNAPLDLRIGQ